MRAEADPEGFWAEQAAHLDWTTPWERVLQWQPARFAEGAGSVDVGDPEAELSVPVARWFVGGTLNVAVNCVDRHVAAGRGDKVAPHFEGERGDQRTVTYADLLAEVAARRTPSRRSAYVPETASSSTCRCSPRRWWSPGVRADRRRPLPGVRRVLRRGAALPAG